MKRQFNTLTGFLTSKSSSPSVNDTVEFQGYAAIGDGGAAVWQHNGVTAQPVSQSPAQLGDALLNDGNGNQWKLVGISATAKLELNVLALGAKYDNLTDDSAAHNAGLAALGAAGGGVLLLASGTTRANIVNTFGKVSIKGGFKSTIIAPTSGICLVVSGITSGEGSEITGMSFSGLNGAVAGLSVAGYSRGKFSTLSFQDALQDGVLIDGNASTEFWFNDVYMNGVTRNPILYSRTNGVDTGGVYWKGLWITGSPSSEPHIVITSSHTSKTRAFMFFDMLISDNAPNGCVKINNSSQVHIRQSWLTGTADLKGLLDLSDIKDVTVLGASIQNSSATGYNILFSSGEITDLEMDLRLSGPGEDLHVVSANISRSSLKTNSTTSTKTNSSSSYRKLISKGSAKAYQTVAQTISTGVFTTVNLSSEVYDDENLVDLATDRYTTAHYGLYSIEAQATYLASSDQNRYSIKLLKNGADTVSLTHEEGSGTGNQTVFTGGSFYLEQGDTIEMQTRQDSGSDKALVAGQELTRLTVTMVRQQ